MEELIARYLETKVKLADTTLENYKHIFQMAVDDDIIRKNPCMGCMKDYPRGSLGSNKEALTVAEQEELLKFARNSVIYEKYYVLLAFLLFTGLIRTTL